MSESLAIETSTSTSKSMVQYYIAMTMLGIAIMALPFSVTICHTAIVLYLVNWAFEGNWRRKFLIIKGNVLLILVIVLFIVEVLSTIFSETSGIAGFEKKIFFVLLPLALATSDVRLTVKNIYHIFYLFVASCFVCSIICLFNAAYQIELLTEGSPLTILTYLDGSDFRSLNPDASDGWLSFSYISLASGIGIHPTYFALYLAFAVTFLLFKVDTSPLWLKTLSWLLVTYFSFFVILLSSRIIIAGLMFIFLITIVYSIRKQATRTMAIGVLVVMVLCCNLLYLNPVSRYRNLQEIPFTSLHIQSNTNYMNSTEIRASLWWIGLRAFERVNLFWGTGTDDVYDAMKQVSHDYQITNSLETYDPHNQFIFTLIGSGIIGFSLFVAFIGCSLFYAITRHDYLYMTFVFLFILLCITETALQLQKGIIFFAIFFSLLAFKKRTKSPTIKMI